MEKEKNKKASKFASFVNTFSGILTLVSFIALIISRISKFNEKNIGFILLIFTILAFVFWFFYSFIRASKSFKTTAKLPFPAFLWRFFLNELPTSAGKRYEKKAKTKVLIVYDESTKEKFESIKNKYSDVSLSIDSINIQNEKDSSKNLPGKLDCCDALLFFFTENVKNKKFLFRLIDNWAFKNSHKPVLAVTDHPYDITYNSIPEKESDSSLWRLLSRSTERSLQWRMQANLFRRIGFVLLIVSVILIPLTIQKYVSERNVFENICPKKFESKIKDIDIQFASMDFRQLAEFMQKKTLGVRKEISVLYKTKKENVLKSLAGILGSYSKNVLVNIKKSNNIISSEEQPTVLSVWIKCPESSSIVKIACSTGVGKQLTAMPFERNSIIGCAFHHPKFCVWWKDSLNNGDKAVWSWNNSFTDKDYRAKWICKDGNCHIEFNDGEKGNYMNLKYDPEDRKGLLCLAEQFYAKKGMMVGVCLDTSLYPDFLTKKRETQDYLQKMLFVLQIIPPEILVDIIETFRSQNYL